MCGVVNQVTVSDATSPSNFSCQLTSSILALELLRNNMNEVYGLSSRRHSQHDEVAEAGAEDAAGEQTADTSVAGLDVSGCSEFGTRRTGNIERPLGVHLGRDTAYIEEAVNADGKAEPCGEDEDGDMSMVIVADLLEPGLCCAARFSDDSWYRARVKSVDGDAVKIVFADYGSEAIIGVEDLRWLKERFTVDKVMSFQCQLEGWAESAGDEAVHQFSELVLNRKLLADVVSKTDETYVVRLLDMGLSIGERMKNPDAFKPVSVFVTSATSPHDFWCRIIDSASTAELPLLMDLIADLYSGDNGPYMVTNFDPDDEDMLYAARYSDGVWYRAKIISSHQSSTPATVDVLFVDYGTKTEVVACDLRILPENCQTLPPQAVHCRLAGIEPTTGAEAVWDDSSMSRFVELVMCTDDERAFQLNPLSSVRNVHGEVVELCGRLLDGDRDIGALLVDSGYAVDCDAVKPDVGVRRRSSCLSEERCHLFVSFDAVNDDVAGTESVECDDDDAKGQTDDVAQDLGTMVDGIGFGGDDDDVEGRTDDVGRDLDGDAKDNTGDEFSDALAGAVVELDADGKKADASDEIAVTESGNKTCASDDGVGATADTTDEDEFVDVDSAPAAADNIVGDEATETETNIATPGDDGAATADKDDAVWLPVSYEDENASYKTVEEVGDDKKDEEFAEAVEDLGKFFASVVIAPVAMWFDL